jgi:cell division protein FtsW
MKPRVSAVSTGNYLRKHKPDYSLLLIVGLLLLFGVVVVYTISPAIEQNTVMYRQIAHIGVAVIAFMFAATTPLNWWKKIHVPLLGLSLISSLLLFVSPLSLEANGATRWLDLGIFSFQPAELLKFALIVYLASLLSERIRTNRLDSVSDTLVPMLVITTIAGLLVALMQKDLGTMVAITGIFLSMLYVSGLRFGLFSRYIGFVIGAIIVAVIFVPHRISRLTTFFDSSQDLSGASYHINQALVAVGSGGWFGKGLGKSVQVFGYLPEAINDSIFAIIAEEFGFIGSMLVLFLYGALCVRLLKIIARSPNAYIRLLVAGVFGWLLSHVVINVGAMLGLMPLTGITLPLLSFGGTSLLFISAGLGLCFNASRYSSLAYTRKEKSDEDLVGRRRNRRTHSTAINARLRA